MAKSKTKVASNLLEAQNAAKTLLANIKFQAIDNEMKTLLLTSSVPDEGKTTAACYLAEAAATAGNNVLLVEADMRRRSLANMLDLHPQSGIVSVLMGTVKLADAIVPTSVNGLYFLDAEPSVPNAADLLASKRMAKLNEHLASQFDYVIYDTPPVGTFIDAAILGRIVDGAILVVRPGKVKRQELQMAYEQLANAEVNVLGLCPTFVEGSGSEYYYSYYKDGRRKKKSKSIDASMLAPSAGSHTASVSFDASTGRADNASERADSASGRSVPRKPSPAAAADSQAIAAGRGALSREDAQTVRNRAARGR